MRHEVQGAPPADDDGPVSIELSVAQVDRVVRSVSGKSTISALLAGLGGAQGTLSAWDIDDPRYSRSLLLGLTILRSLPPDNSYRMNREISEAVGINPSTCHRYLTTLVVAGLAERDASSRRYRRSLTAASLSGDSAKQLASASNGDAR